MNVPLVIILLVILLISNSNVEARDDPCVSDERVVGICFDIHARLRLNANMRLYLWPIGTNRLLAVSYMSDVPEADPVLPSNLVDVMNSDKEVFGDFRVCPFTKEDPGKIQIICVESAENLVLKNRKVFAR